MFSMSGKFLYKYSSKCLYHVHSCLWVMCRASITLDNLPAYKSRYLINHFSVLMIELDESQWIPKLINPSKGEHRQPRNTWCRTGQAELKEVNLTWSESSNMAKDRTKCRRLVEAWFPTGEEKASDKIRKGNRKVSTTLWQSIQKSWRQLNENHKCEPLVEVEEIQKWIFKKFREIHSEGKISVIPKFYESHPRIVISVRTKIMDWFNYHP